MKWTSSARDTNSQSSVVKEEPVWRVLRETVGRSLQTRFTDIPLHAPWDGTNGKTGKMWWGHKETGTLVNCWWARKMVRPQPGSFPTGRSRSEFPYSSAISPLGGAWERWKDLSTQNLYANVHSTVTLTAKKKEKQHKRPPAGEWRECGTSIRWNITQVWKGTKAWHMLCRGGTLKMPCQSQDTTRRVISFRWNVQNRRIHRDGKIGSGLGLPAGSRALKGTRFLFEVMEMF